MFGFQYVKASPATYLIQYRNGEAVREGAGLSFFFFAPSSSLVSMPIQTTEAPFIFREVCNDYQEITIQGQVTYRIADAKVLAGMMDFTLKRDGSGYQSDEPGKLPQRVVNAVQVQVKAAIQKLPLERALQAVGTITQEVRRALSGAEGLRGLGLEVMDFSILAIKPTPETARALEARVREAILKDADDAVYARRNSAIDQERSIKENELKTEVAIETKKRQIRETQMEAEMAVLEKRQQIDRQQMEGRVEIERRNQELVQLATDNTRREAEVKAYALDATMKAIGGVDAKVLQALTLGSSDPSILIALAFQGLADNAQKIGELNISPDLLKQLMVKKA